MSDSDDIIGNHNLQWNNNIEIMLSKWCDQSKCYEWMHTESCDYFSRKSQRLTIAITVLGSISGLSNVISGNYNSDNKLNLSWLFGSISILVSMMSILQDKLSYQSLANEFRQYSIEWSIIRRNIEEELTIPIASRENCATFLKFIRKAVNQVYTNSSSKIPKHIKELCFEKFKNIADFDIPDICGQIEHTVISVDNLVQSIEV